MSGFIISYFDCCSTFVQCLLVCMCVLVCFSLCVVIIVFFSDCHIYLLSSLAARVFNKLTYLLTYCNGELRSLLRQIPYQSSDLTSPGNSALTG